jgi:hypothetical protein
VPLPSATDAPSIPPPSAGHPRDQDRQALAAKEEADREQEHDTAVVSAGKSARQRLKRDTARLNDYRLVGEALLAGRRACMAEAGVSKPRGLRYVQANSRWLKEQGFDEIVKTTRQTSMLIAENWKPVTAWLKTLSAERRTRLTHPQVVWREYQRSKTKPKPTKDGKNWRNRQSITDLQALQAIDAVTRILP